MQPFKIQCTTCRRSLRVVDPQAVGQILACPKCQSFVLVEAPPGWELSPNPVVEQTVSAAAPALTASDSFPAPPGLTASSVVIAATVATPRSDSATAPKAGTSTVPPNSNESRGLPPAPVNAATIAPAGNPDIPAAPTKGTADESAGFSARVAEPMPAGESAALNSWPKWFWPSAGGIVVLSLAILGLRLALQRSETATAPHVNSDGVIARSTNSGAPPTDVSVAPNAANEAKQASGIAKEDHSLNEPSIAIENSSSASDGISTKPDQALSTTVKPELPAPQPAMNVQPAASPQSSPEPSPTIAGSPEIKPAEQGTKAPAVSSSDTAPIVKSETPAASPQRIGAAGPMRFGATPENDMLPPKDQGAAGQAGVAPFPEAATQRTLRRVAPRTVDVAKRLVGTIPSLEVQRMPLVDFAALISDLSTVPISFDADAITEMGRSFVAPIDVKLNTVTVADALQAGLKGLQLGYRVQGNQLIVGYPQQPSLREARYTVVDLTGNDPNQLADLALLVRRFVSPNSWQQAGGTGTMTGGNAALVVTQDEAVHTQIVLLCEKLRMVRGLPLRSRFDPSRFALLTRMERAKQLLSLSITVNFNTPQSLGGVVKWLHSNTGATILIDDAALAAQETSADSECAAVVSGKPLSTFLDELLSPIDLAWRAIDERTIEITTRTAAATRMEVEFYAVREIAADAQVGQNLISQIQSKVEPLCWGERLDQSAIRFDAPSKSLIVRAPQKVQTEVAGLLKAMDDSRDQATRPTLK